jgi:aldose 1-epimerase
LNVDEKKFGVLYDGRKVRLYTLKAGDLSLTLSNFGATMVSLFVPSKRFPKEDILLGYSTFDGYSSNIPFLGASIGRFGNRIGGASFSLDGNTYNLHKNNSGNTLHGGRRGFDKRLWSAEAYEKDDGVFVRFELESPDGDEGFPGNLKAVICYGLTKSNELVIDYKATVDKRCPLNLTNHAYYNLAGEGKCDILSHEMQIYASRYVEVNSNLIPTGKMPSILGGPFDFTAKKVIGKDIEQAGGGYDHCYILDSANDDGTLKPCAEVFEPISGRSMKVFTTQPGVQFYSGNFLNNVRGKIGSVYNKHAGFCLETQHLPDSPNQPNFPPCIYGPGKDYHEKALFSFSW